MQEVHDSIEAGVTNFTQKHPDFRADIGGDLGFAGIPINNTNIIVMPCFFTFGLLLSLAGFSRSKPQRNPND